MMDSGKRPGFWEKRIKVRKILINFKFQIFIFHNSDVNSAGKKAGRI